MATLTPSTLTVSLSGLDANSAYQFWVEPLNAYQLDTDITDERGVGYNFTTTADKPTSPTGVTVSRTLATVKVEWTPVTMANAVSSYSVAFLNNAGTPVYQTLAGICQVTTCSTTCSCTVPMSTLTSTLLWTAATDTDINVQVTATNVDGTSDPATQTSTIKYLYIPQAAAGLSVSTTSDDTIAVTVTCLSGQDSG